jgi:hypothetical protein
MPAFGPGETLQEFLQDEVGRQKRLDAFDGPHQHPDFGPTRRLVRRSASDQALASTKRLTCGLRD